MYHYKMSHITRKPVFRICNQVRLKPVCAVTETRKRLEISDTETRDIILSRQWTTKVLIKLRRLICVFVVRIWHQQVFSWRGSNSPISFSRLCRMYMYSKLYRYISALPVHLFLTMRSPEHAQMWILKLPPMSWPTCIFTTINERLDWPV